MKKSAQVVMLPTNEKAPTHDYLFLYKPSNRLVKNGFVQHLYFLSDEEIKDGEYGFCMNLFNQGNQPHQIIFKMDSEQRQAMIELGGQKNANVFKIIATTDKSIILPERFPSFTYLPQPSQSFIEKFVEEYNKGNVITEVLVEYEEIQVLKQTLNEGFGSYYHKAESEFVLKVNPTDNTITIRKAKDSWSREEVVELLYKHTEYMLSGKKDTLDKWIEENL